MTRRGFEVVIIAIMLSRPVFGAARLWAVKTFGATTPGSVTHTVAEVTAALV